MSVNMILGISILLLLVVGFTMIYLNLKEVKKVLIATLVIELLVVIYAFINYDHNSIIFSINLFSNFGIGFNINEFNAIYGIVTVALWIVSAIVSDEYFKHHEHQLTRYYGFLIITLAGALGVFYANDLFTLFVFFEIMSFASYLWVVHNGDKNSYQAGNSYLAYAVFGGLALLFGILILGSLINDLTISNLTNNIGSASSEPLLYLSSILMVIGFGAKAGAFFLHDWLALAHSASPAPASGLLSGLLTKTGVYGIIIVVIKIMGTSDSFAYFILFISTLNMLIGAIYAFFSDNLKRTLAYSSVSQIGFILWGVSLTILLKDHNTYAAYGTLFHMLNHSVIKVLLFSLSGIIYQNTHTLSLKELEGWGRDKPWLKVCFAIGSLSIMGIPLFSGFISKTLLHEAMVEMIHFHIGNHDLNLMLEYLFLLAGGFTFAYMLKLNICLFFKKGNHQPVKEYTTNKSRVALTVLAVLLVIFGILPNITFDKLGEFTAHFMNTHAKDGIHYFIWINIRGALISISIGLFLYFVVMKSTVLKNNGYNDYHTSSITIENYIYKPLIKLFSLIAALILRIVDISADVLIVVINKLFYKSSKIPLTFYQGKEKGFYLKDRGMHITHSFSYSLLMFGIGLIFTILYLIFVGLS